MHRFSDKTTPQGKWYAGHVLAYDEINNEYEVTYEDEDEFEPCYFGCRLCYGTSQDS